MAENQEPKGVSWEVPEGAYVGPATPFGGPSLEWFIEHHDGINYEKAQKARVPTDGEPKIINGMLYVCGGELPYKFLGRAGRSSVNAERMAAELGLIIMERMVSDRPKIVRDRLRFWKNASMDEITSEDEKKFQLELKGGKTPAKRPQVNFCDLSHVARVGVLSQHLGLARQVIALLCLVLGLAQSVNPEWVRPDVRAMFIEQGRKFEVKLDKWVGK